MDRLAPVRRARRPAARQRPRPDAENFGGDVSCSFGSALCGYFNLDLHARIGQARLDHGRGRPHIAEMFLEHRPTGLEILAPRQYVAHAYDIFFFKQKTAYEMPK